MTPHQMKHYDVKLIVEHGGSVERHILATTPAKAIAEAFADVPESIASRVVNVRIVSS